VSDRTAAIRDALDATRLVARNWDALSRCSDASEPDDMGACAKYRDALDTAIVHLKAALQREGDHAL
jgi:hypothetical protein